MFAHPIDLAKQQFDRYGLQRYDDRIFAILNDLVLKYLDSRDGRCWIFYNSDIKVFDDEGKYRYTVDATQERLDPRKVTVFVKHNFEYWEKRLQNPGLTAEEIKKVYVPIAKVMNGRRQDLEVTKGQLAVWALLMWHGSPYPAAVAWRKAKFKYYARGLEGDFIDHAGTLFDLDDIDMEEHRLLMCKHCGRLSACVAIDVPGGTAYCGYCTSSGECAICTHVCDRNSNTVANQSVPKLAVGAPLPVSAPPPSATPTRLLPAERSLSNAK